ncbi:unnamed protein product [Phyllotreta striolata]|uniref:Uncharacterized protein n=1 Tax=Phyllotreta striolata TaxID=444603 RepID=A0A9N9TMW5_PHYSR|nr:unnamed protein product [Phyllotreta striolata]
MQSSIIPSIVKYRFSLLFHKPRPYSDDNDKFDERRKVFELEYVLKQTHIQLKELKRKIRERRRAKREELERRYDEQERAQRERDERNDRDRS